MLKHNHWNQFHFIQMSWMLIFGLYLILLLDNTERFICTMQWQSVSIYPHWCKVNDVHEIELLPKGVLGSCLLCVLVPVLTLCTCLHLLMPSAPAHTFCPHLHHLLSFVPACAICTCLHLLMLSVPAQTFCAHLHQLLSFVPACVLHTQLHHSQLLVPFIFSL